MNTKEIVKILREDMPCNKDCPLIQKCVRGSECPTDLAADIIESQAQQIVHYVTLLGKSLVKERAAVRDLEELMSEVGLVNYVTCAYCQLPDDYTCLGEDGKCKAKWRGPGKTEGNGE